MWIIRFHKLEPRDYNLFSRSLKKLHFFPKRIPPVIFIKSILLHLLQKKSRRNISVILNCNYMAIFNFYNQYGKSAEVLKIFHTLADRRIIVHIADNKVFSESDLDNNDTILKLTKAEINNIF